MPFLAVEIGKHRITVLLVKKEKEQVTILQEMTKVIPGYEDVRVCLPDMLRVFIKQNKVTTRKASLTVYDPAVIAIKNVVLPVMPTHELVQALNWHAKDEGSLTPAHVLFNYQVVKEFIDDDEAKKCAVVYSIVHRKFLENLLSILVQAGFEVRQVTAAPLDYPKILACYGESTEPLALLDVGYNHSTLAIYQRGQLIFFRDLSFSFERIKKNLSDPLFLSADIRGEAADEKIEKALKEFGVPVEDVAAGGAEDAGQSGKIFALIRPLVEGLVREIRYSFTYFMTNLKEEKPAKLFITGFGTKFKNLDVFLGRELSLNVQTLLLPAKIQNRLVVDSEDPIETSQCVSGVAGLFAGGAAVNFLPFEFRCLKFESIQRKFLLLVAVALAGVLTMSFFFIRLQSSFVSHQISIQEHHLQALGIYGDLSGKAFPRHFLISEIERGTVPANGVLKLLAHLLPREIVINRFVLDAANKQVLLDVSVELPEGQRGAAVEGYALRLKKSSFFKKVSLQALPGVSGTSYRLEGIFHDD